MEKINESSRQPFHRYEGESGKINLNKRDWISLKKAASHQRMNENVFFLGKSKNRSEDICSAGVGGQFNLISA